MLALVLMATVGQAAHAAETSVPAGARQALAAVHAEHRATGRMDVMLPTGPAVLDYAAALVDHGAPRAARFLVSAILDDIGMKGSEDEILGLKLGAMAVAAQAFLRSDDPSRASLVLRLLDQAGAPALSRMPPRFRLRRDAATADLARRAEATGDAAATLNAWDTQAQSLFDEVMGRQETRQAQFDRFLSAFADARMDDAAGAGEALLAVIEPDDIIGVVTTMMLARSLAIGRDSPDGTTGQNVASARLWLERALDVPAAFLAAIPGTNAGAANPVETLVLASAVFRQEKHFDAEFAVVLANRAAEIATAVGPESHPDFSAALEALAGALDTAGDREPAEAAWNDLIGHYRGQDLASLPLDERRRFAHATAAAAALAAAAPGREASAEAGFVDALRIAESGGPDLVDMRSDILVQLGDFYSEQSRHEDALGVYRSAAALGEQAGLSDTPAFVYVLARLGVLEVQLGAISEAKLTLARARSLALRKLTPTDPVHEMILEGLVGTYEQRGEAAPPSLADALQAARASQVSSPAPMVARAEAFAQQIDLAHAAFAAGDFDTGLVNARSALAFAEETGEPNWQIDALRTLAILQSRREDHQAALPYFRRAEALQAGSPTVTLAERQNDILAHLQTAFFAANEADGAVARPLYDEAFSLAQQLNRARVGAELQRANLRRTLDARPVAGVLRRLQDEQGRRDDLAAELMVRLSTGQPIAGSRAAIEEMDATIGGLQAELEREFPDFAAYLGTSQTSLKEATEVLADREALVVFATRPVETPDGTVQIGAAFLLTRGGFASTLIHFDGDLAVLARRLRCAAALTDPRCVETRDTAGSQRGAFALGDPNSPAAAQDGPGARYSRFDYAAAYEAFEALVQPLSLESVPEDIDKLVIVPDSSLVAMPFNLMVTAPTPDGIPFDEAPWLLRQVAVTIAPTVSSFVGLRRDKPRGKAVSARPADRFLGIGDPLIGQQLLGPIDVDCSAISDRIAEAAPIAGLQLSQRGILGDSATLSALSALPDTKCELNATAALFEDRAKVLVREQATETAIKSLSSAGDLRDYSVVSFATHGLIAGEIGANLAALVLTPPQTSDETDDGLLTSPEIAALDLDADFVLLSACNTAAGEARDAEGLTGLAGAFFYAGAHNLLVSHWPVYSDAATRLTTGLMGALANDPGLGRAQALRLSMLAILDDPRATARERHPAYWAPFMIVGEGGAR